MKNMRVGPKPKKVGSQNITRSMLEPKKRKAKRTVDDDEPAKPVKKKKPGTALVVQTPEKKRKPKTDLVGVSSKDLKSYFGDHSDKIMKMIEMGDSDGGLTILKRRLLLTTIRILPKAEEVLNESGTSRGTYQFVTLVSQIRELMTDIQADQDRRYIARRILDTIVKPSFMNIAQDILTDHHDFRRRTDDLVKPDSHAEFSSEMKQLATRLAGKMTDHYRELEAKIIEALQT